MIKITDIAPFMKKGWVAMDKSGSWWWYGSKPELLIEHNHNHGWLEDCWYNPDNNEISNAFDIAPADDWTKSLIKVGGK